MLGVGERISRIAEPTDHEYYPIRPGETGSGLPGQGRTGNEVQIEGDVEIEGEGELDPDPDQP